jgi:hypothetical protein
MHINPERLDIMLKELENFVENNQGHFDHPEDDGHFVHEKDMVFRVLKRIKEINSKVI